jgi:hypothetical protein
MSVANCVGWGLLSAVPPPEIAFRDFDLPARGR